MHYDKNKRWVEKATAGEVKATSRWGPQIGNLMFYLELLNYKSNTTKGSHSNFNTQPTLTPVGK